MNIPTENWILYRDHSYQATPWPFAKSFDAFLAAPEPLQNPCGDFGRAPACDGLSETPSVPAHLPRAVPAGKHAFAVYHDSENIYAFLESHDSPQIVTDAQLDAIPHMAATHRRYPCLTLFTPDNRTVYMFSLDGNGAKTVRHSTALYGPRKAPPAKRDIPFDYATITLPTAPGASTSELACWRIPRSSIADTFLGNTLKISVSRLRLQTLEHVAWGSAAVWGPRYDEMGTVQLVTEKQTLPWPTVKRVDLSYNPSSEHGTLHVTWDGIFTPEELASPSPYPYSRPFSWDNCVIRVNDIKHLFNLKPQIDSPSFPLPEGHTQIHIASTGGPGARFTLEKRSGNRIVEADFPPTPTRSLNWIIDRTRTELDQWAKDIHARAAMGKDRKYVHLELFNSTPFGLMHHDLEPSQTWLDALRVQADYALSMQREDGSFAGYHLMDRKPSPWAGGSFDTGQAGELWVTAAAVLKDEKYLTASRKLVHAYKDYRVEFNHNYAAFTMYHLCAHYRLTQDPLALEHAIYYAQHLVSTDLMPLGFHGAHNYYGCYGSITLRGLAHLAQVLPDSHPFAPVLRERCIRMTNQAISRQQPDGTFDTRDRYFVAEGWWMWGFFPIAFLLAPADLVRLDRVIQRMLHSPELTEKPEGRYTAYTDAIRYFKRREALLAGEKFNPLGML
jgi:hypothetical protein